MWGENFEQRRSVARRRGTLPKWKKPSKPRPEVHELLQDKARLQALAHSRVKEIEYEDGREESARSAGNPYTRPPRTFHDRHPTVRKVLELFVRCAANGSVSGAEYGKSLTDDELSNLIIGMDGVVTDWYTGTLLPIQEAGKYYDYNWVSPQPFFSCPTFSALIKALDG